MTTVIPEVRETLLKAPGLPTPTLANDLPPAGYFVNLRRPLHA